jgi:hypothetical protein
MRGPASLSVFILASVMPAIAQPAPADSCLADMDAYFAQHLFNPGRNVARTRFLMASRFASNFSPAPYDCSGKAYAWELLSQIAREAPKPGSDWTHWNWNEPGGNGDSALSDAFTQFVLQNWDPERQRENTDFTTFEMVHMNPEASRHAQKKIMDPGKRNEASALGWRSFPDFPAGSTELKTIWRRIPEGRCITLGIWDHPPSGDAILYGDAQWDRHVIVYDAPHGKEKPGCSDRGSRPSATGQPLRGQDHFLWMRVDHATQTGRFKSFPKSVQLSQGDLLILVGMHIARKDAPDWAWVTTYWKEDASADQTRGRDRVIKAWSPWSKYVLNYSLSFQYPTTPPTGSNTIPNYVYNPYLEAGILENGTHSNCVACHAKARYSKKALEDKTQVPPTLGADLMLHLFENATMSDYSWTAVK